MLLGDICTTAELDERTDGPNENESEVEEGAEDVEDSAGDAVGDDVEPTVGEGARKGDESGSRRLLGGIRLACLGSPLDLTCDRASSTLLESRPRWDRFCDPTRDPFSASCLLSRFRFLSPGESFLTPSARSEECSEGENHPSN